jgi:hypothetical protein
MSLAIKYETVDDARMRLRNTIVLYRGVPVIITNVFNGEEPGEVVRVTIAELPHKGGAGGEDPFERRPVRLGDAPLKEGEQRKFLSSKHFDIAPFKLGYVNSQKGAFYCTRLPNRIQKQGLCGENFRAFDNFGRQVPYASFVACKETPAMIGNIYPSFDLALRSLEQVPSVAFCRDFSLVKDEVVPELVYLYHKGAKVGFFSKSEITLGKKFACLKESLQEMHVKVGAC